MFAAYCHQHGTRVLLPTTNITAIVPGPDGLIAHFVCSCGTHGVWEPRLER